jgi:hypothetical protein
MDTKGSNTFRWVSVIVIGLVVALCVWLAIPRLDTAALSAILGALVGAAVPGLVALWSKNRELEEHLKDRVSSQALDGKVRFCGSPTASGETAVASSPRRYEVVLCSAESVPGILQSPPLATQDGYLAPDYSGDGASEHS